MYAEASREDLQTLFANTIIRYNKIPSYVKDVTEEKELALKPVLEGGFKRIKLYDPLLDFTPVPLGMCNHGGGAFFLSRRPLRQFAQGLHANTLSILAIACEDKKLAILEVQTLKAKGLHSCILGEYPPFAECLETLSKDDNGVDSLAFSREFAIDKDLSLFFKYEKVGLVSADNGKIVYQRSKAYLKELSDARCT